VNKEVDLVALLSLSSTLRGERKSLPSMEDRSSIVLRQLIYGHQGYDRARETTCPGGSQVFHFVWGCCVLYESTAVALSSHTGEESTMAQGRVMGIWEYNCLSVE